MLVGRHHTVPPQAKLFLALMTSQTDLIEQVKTRIVQKFGDIDAATEPFDFDPLTAYYAAEFGTGLRKCLVSVDPLIPADRLASIKTLTNAWECEFASPADHRRQINVDPGYLTLLNVVLASTKPTAHRIYVHNGIYQETTLIYAGAAEGYRPMPWTYPDYATPRVSAFFAEARALLKQQSRAER